VIVCGPRSAAFGDFKSALACRRGDEKVYLLVDAEAPVAAGAPSEAAAWSHVAARVGDGWEQPAAGHDDHLHLMVQTMEAWFLADREAFKRWFGPKCNLAKLPSDKTLPGSVAKATLEAALNKAAAETPAGEYRKGRDSFEVLKLLDPAKIEPACPWAARLFETLRRDL
jgi:hypothetical protein